MAVRALSILITFGALLFAPASAQDSTNTISLSSAEYHINEASTNLVVTMLRSGDTNATTSVDYQLELLTATEADLLPHSGAITFAPGQTNATTLIEVLDDTTREQPETFRLTLSNPTPDFTLTPNPSADITIHDNDHPAGIDESFHLLGFNTFGPRVPSVQKILSLQDGSIFVGGETSALVVDQHGTKPLGVAARVTDAAASTEGTIHYISRDDVLRVMNFAGVQVDHPHIALYSYRSSPTLTLLDSGHIMIGGWLAKGYLATNGFAR